MPAAALVARRHRARREQGRSSTTRSRLTAAEPDAARDRRADDGAVAREGLLLRARATPSDGANAPTPSCSACSRSARRIRSRPGERLPASVGLDINRKLSCATPDEFGDYAAKHPQGGMPYGMAPLRDAELGVLASWATAGRAAAGAVRAAAGARAASRSQSWEAFLNGDSLKQRVVARYLYEHWFVAHLYFDDLPAGPFFRVVRSRTPQRPADRRDRDAAPLRRSRRRRLLPPAAGRSDDRPQDPHRLRALARADGAPAQALPRRRTGSRRAFPSYAPERGVEPVRRVRRDPARAAATSTCSTTRSTSSMTFIRGPVCRGQVAVDVIEDQFWVAFLDPDHDLSVDEPRLPRERRRSC